jgi:hypothetical protein
LAREGFLDLCIYTLDAWNCVNISWCKILATLNSDSIQWFYHCRNLSHESRISVENHRLDHEILIKLSKFLENFKNQICLYFFLCNLYNLKVILNLKLPLWTILFHQILC